MNENEKTSQKSIRLTSIDALRGLVIILMALDHSRDFFGDLRINTEDPATTTWALFMTRWVTHFCAPTFVFLAGTSAWLYGQKVGSKTQLSKFLFTRGLWLLFLEFTVIYFALALSFDIVPWMFLVIATIGVSLIALSLLCFLPAKWVLIIGVAIVSGHNLLDPIDPSRFGSLEWIWLLIHGGPGYIPWLNLEVGYPFLAWIGVICLGYGSAAVFQLPPKKKLRLLVAAGLIMILAFLCLRTLNGYGNGQKWEVQQTTDEISASVDFSRTAFSFLRVTKYPPSLVFLLMTLGPALIAVALLELLNDDGWLKQKLIVFGRVPLFFYVVHFYILHLGSIATYWFFKGVPLSPFQAIYGQLNEIPIPPEFGFSTLWQVYVAWAGVVLIMYPLCRAYGKLRRRSKNPLWSYL